MAGVLTLCFETYTVPKNMKIIRHPLLRGLQCYSCSLLNHLHPPCLSTALPCTNSSPQPVTPSLCRDGWTNTGAGCVDSVREYTSLKWKRWQRKHGSPYRGRRGRLQYPCDILHCCLYQNVKTQRHSLDNPVRSDLWAAWSKGRETSADLTPETHTLFIHRI